ncbi:ABC transporter permease subunit [Falsibacillus pallidus]|uniref:Peptide/nickel transport system permease protein n=1 Tax=Falsibacillus pallidus TaxID=493781 RepID=A0A370G5Q6_9BACI|nr:ABC transporter permease subunit [Falsibacillus pallidus]RDI39147.1 peptide/nickel transport system permease protein [Falsibacillus pallidus]
MNRSLGLGLSLLVFLFLISIFAPYLPFVDQSLKPHLMRQSSEGMLEIAPFPPSKEFPIGTDFNGIDLLSRLLMGAKETLLTVLGICVLRYIFAIPLGILSFYSRIIRTILFVWNRVFSFLPPIFFIIILVGSPFISFSSNRYLLFMFVIALVEVGRVGDIFYQFMNQLSRKPYIEAGIVGGNSNFRMIQKYYLPPLIPHIIIQFFSDLGRIMFLIGQLGIVEIFFSVKFVSQLGGSYKAINTTNIWPIFFVDITKHIWAHAWMPITGALAIGVTIFTFSLLSNGFRKYFNQKYKKNNGVEI